MFQTSNLPAIRPGGAERVGLLRAWPENGPDVIVPRLDEHQEEYVALGSERLNWLTGFSGSAGVAPRLAGPGGDGRAGRATRCKLRNQVDLSIFTVES